MEDLKCLICFEDAKDARACPKCAKIFCHGCIKKCGANNFSGFISCPHCRGSRHVSEYVKLNFVDRLRKELTEKEEKSKTTASKLHRLQCQLTKCENKLKQQEEDKSTASANFQKTLKAKEVQMDNVIQGWKLETSEKDRQLTALRQEMETLEREIHDDMVQKVADKCSNHPPKQKLLYCDDCKMAICSDCRQDFPNHPFRLIEDVGREAVQDLAFASRRNLQMRDLLFLEADHKKHIDDLREERERIIAEYVAKMREKHESAIQKASADVDLAFTELREFQSHHEKQSHGIKLAMDSPLMNRVAEQKPIIHDLVSKADVVLERTRGIPSIVNLQNGCPSISIDTNEILRPWLADQAQHFNGANSVATEREIDLEHCCSSLVRKNFFLSLLKAAGSKGVAARDSAGKDRAEADDLNEAFLVEEEGEEEEEEVEEVVEESDNLVGDQFEWMWKVVPSRRKRRDKKQK